MHAKPLIRAIGQGEFTRPGLIFSKSFGHFFILNLGREEFSHPDLIIKKSF